MAEPTEEQASRRKRPPLLRRLAVRLSLLSFVLSTTVVILFAGIASWAVLSANKRQLVSDLKENVLRLAMQPPRGTDWKSAFEQVAESAADSRLDHVLMVVVDVSGEKLFDSAEQAGTVAGPVPEVPEGRPGKGSGNRLRPRPRPGPDGQPDGREGKPSRVLPPTDPEIAAYHIDGKPFRIATSSSPGVSVALGISDHLYRERAFEVIRIFLYALPPSLLVIALMSWIFAQRVLRPVYRLTHAVETITASGLDQRIDPAGEAAEFETLISVFNGMLERLQRSFNQARRFSADAAHELRTPLTILQGELERAVERGGDRGQQSVRMLEEVQRLNNIVEKLSLLAKADSGQLPIFRKPVRLPDLLASLREDAELLAPKLDLRIEADPGLPEVSADPDLLTHLLQNLLSNAIKYNVPGGWIRIRLAREEGHALLEMQNATAPLPEHLRDRLFERFYRGDPSRSREIDGAGLGLSLAHEIAMAHGADLELIPSTPEVFGIRLRIPIAPAEQEGKASGPVTAASRPRAER